MASELGTIGRLGDGGNWREIIDVADARCAAAGLSTIGQLDAAAKFNRKLHLEAAHASVLTYAIASADYTRRRDDATWTPVGVCGNSLGWYTAVHVAGALPFEAALDIVLSTGGYQRSHPQVGGPALTATTTLAARGTPVRHAHPNHVAHAPHKNSHHRIPTRPRTLVQSRATYKLQQQQSPHHHDRWAASSCTRRSMTRGKCRRSSPQLSTWRSTRRTRRARSAEIDHGGAHHACVEACDTWRRSATRRCQSTLAVRR